MSKKADIIFDSENTYEKTYQIASGHISTTVIFFEKENVYAVIEAKGSVEFFDAEDNLIAKGSVPAVSDGREVYEEIRLSANGGIIKLEFPICKWVDNYTHFDGEHDRWDSVTIGYNKLLFDSAKGTVL